MGCASFVCCLGFCHLKVVQEADRCTPIDLAAVWQAAISQCNSSTRTSILLAGRFDGRRGSGLPPSRPAPPRTGRLVE